MIKPVKLEYHDVNRPFLDPLLEAIKDNPALHSSFQDPSKSTFIVARDEVNGIYGGALLLKKRISSLHRKAGMPMLAYQPKKVWTCTVCIQIKESERSSCYESFCKIFYRNLYEKLIEFGIKEKIDFLWMMLDSTEHLSTKFIGFWPYEAQVRPKQSLDGLFHGILSLTKGENTSLPKEKRIFNVPSLELRFSA